MRYLTNFSAVSDVSVYSLFRRDMWEQLDNSDKYAALQELANRSAKLTGTTPCKVVGRDLQGATYGYYNHGVITINSELVEHGSMKAIYPDDDGTLCLQSVTVPACSIQLMSTVFHEDTHALQDQARHNPALIPDPELRRSIIANGRADTYISCEVDENLYRIQPSEKQAFEMEQRRTEEAFSELNSIYGEDPEYSEYVAAVGLDSYEAALEEARFEYDDPEIEKTLSDTISDRYYGEHSVKNAESSSRVEWVLDRSRMEFLYAARTESAKLLEQESYGRELLWSEHYTQDMGVKTESSIYGMSDRGMENSRDDSIFAFSEENVYHADSKPVLIPTDGHKR